ncbi:MAG: acetate--CoA ligase family protein [Ectothiorhodospiraceae bacterium]|nr:acetate--CoA ligase family protein [Ectothiorhodospiraceae bacterium]
MVRSRNLDCLFNPGSVAVIGASDRGTGGVIMRNLLAGGFNGPIMPVNPRRRAAAGVLAYPDVASLPLVPDLAVIATPPSTLPGIVGALGERGGRAAVVVTELSDQPGNDGDQPLVKQIREAARPHGLRVLGPGSLGAISPASRLNASVAYAPARSGRIAFVTQSGALGSAVLDWTREKGIGFSHFLAMGEPCDVGFADVLDYLAADHATSAILLYIETIDDGPRFVTAARAAARGKPVVAVKAGLQGDRRRGDETSYAGALAGLDDLFEAVLRRTGVLPVRELEELFDAVETLGRGLHIRGDRLGVVTSGGGTGTMARDALMAAGLQPAVLAPDTIGKLQRLSPPPRSIGCPVDVGIRGPVERHGAAARVLLDADELDATLVIQAPSSHETAEEVARTLMTVTSRSGRRQLLTAWMGGQSTAEARRLLAESGIASYETPGSAVKAFAHLVNHHRNQQLLMQIPPQLPVEQRPEVEAVRRLVSSRAGDGALPESDAIQVLAAYGVATVPIRAAADPDEAADISGGLGFPIALTLNSPDIPRLRDAGGIALYLNNAQAVRAAAEEMMDRVARERPEARVEGLNLRHMVPRPNARQLFVGVSTDRTFGPVLVVGEGGRALEAYREHAVGLPPLNLPLARDMLSRSRVWQTLCGSRARPDADIDAICQLIVKVSRIVVDFPEIAEMDINPIFADESGISVAGAHMRLAAEGERPQLVFRPYPTALEEQGTLGDGRTVLLRPIRPEDEPLHALFFSRLSSEDLFLRFFRKVEKIERPELARLTQIDYDREMAFIAEAQGEDGGEILGEVRVIADADNERAEYAVVTRTDMKGRGKGRMLMEKAIRN